MARTLVAIPAHADDAELNAGGTIAKWAAEGAEIHVIMMTDNCSGPIVPEGGDASAARRLDPDKTTTIRYKEQEAAAAMYGGKIHYRNYSQRHYWDEKGQREIAIDYEHDVAVPPGLKGHLPLLIAADGMKHSESLGELVVSLKPDLVLTQTPLDLDPEHHAVASMVWKLFRRFEKELADVPLRFWMPGSSCQDGLVPIPYDHFEDITDYFERKLELCGCHFSQMDRTRWQMVKDRAAFFGEKIGAAYAEPFCTATRQTRFGWCAGLPEAKQ